MDRQWGAPLKMLAPEVHTAVARADGTSGKMVGREVSQVPRTKMARPTIHCSGWQSGNRRGGGGDGSLSGVVGYFQWVCGEGDDVLP